MKKREKVRILLAILWLMLTGCTSSATPTPPTTIQQLHSWLTDESCPQPCWQGIRPGVTTRTEALNILNSLPEIQYIEDKPAEDVIDWGVEPTGKRLLGSIYYNSTTNLVTQISYQTEKSLAVYDVFEQIGEPSHLYTYMSSCHKAVCDTYGYTVSLIYADQGIRLIWSEFSLEKGDEVLGFTANQNVFELIFEESSHTQLFLNSNQQTYIQPWQGFSTSFEQYCQSRGCYSFFGRSAPTATPPATPIFANSWLNDHECPSPCWLGIRPGYVTASESLEILKAFPEIVYIQNNKPGHIYWDITPEGKPSLFGEITYNEQTKFVDKISYQTYRALSIEQIIKTIGEPSHASFSIEGNCHTNDCPDTYRYHIALFYDDRFLTLSWYGEVIGWGAKIPNFNPQVTQFEVLFSADYLPVTFNKKWYGFNNLQQYCSDMGASYCRSFLEGPIPSPTP